MIHAVIMAGGAGTRFWPSSRRDKPKQLLNLFGERTMIQATVDRLGDLVSADRTLVITNERLVSAIRRQLSQLPPQNVIGEPCKRDTAPCIGLAAEWVMHEDPEATMIVMPADHVIKDEDQFHRALSDAVTLVEQDPSRLVTFGIPPTYPAESFGYIQRSKPLENTSIASPAFQVDRFREKPQAEVARQYVEAKTYYWNSGIFVWKARTILEQLREHSPAVAEHLRLIAKSFGASDFHSVFEREFAAMNGISIDYAVMEHAPNVVVIEAPFDWDDLGSWQALARLNGTDADGNTISGRHLAIDTRGTIIRNQNDHLVVTLGLEDCLIVHTPDATLVARRQDEERIREVVEKLAAKDWDEFL